ncbi:MAG TPA: hypothetical protein VIC51_08545 [Psychromonas sp.]
MKFELPDITETEKTTVVKGLPAIIKAHRAGPKAARINRHVKGRWGL